MSLSRRSFFSKSGLLASSVIAAPAVGLAAGSAVFKPGRRPRHIIHLVADGMSLGTFTCADHYSELVRDRRLVWATLYNRPEVFSALVNMRSLNSLVTDSAAASSSWGSGSRVKNGALNVLPDGTELRPLYTILGDAGWSRGLVTTTEITHATPAGFAINMKDRGSSDDIAAQYFERRIDVLLGGGRSFFDGKKRSDKRDLKGDFGKVGYWVMQEKSQMADAPMNRPWLGTFASSHLPYTLDQMASDKLRATVPTLAEMTDAALGRLSHAPHFILQVEGGRVDHGAHASDAAATLNDMLAFDEALSVCLDFQKKEPETLIVVTTDHGNSNLGLNGMGSSYDQSSPMFARVSKVRRSFDEMIKDIRRAAGLPSSAPAHSREKPEDIARITPDELSDIIEKSTGYAMPDAKAEAFVRFLAGQQAPIYDQMNSLSAQLGQLLANYLGIGWTGNSHTADYVPLVALGPGAERFRGLLQNTDLFPNFLDLARVRFKNPDQPLLAECGPSAAEAEGWALA